MRTVAVIPARGGSKGVPGKNLARIGGLPLVARTVLAAARATRIDAVVCSSDDPRILAVAERYGAMPIARPAALSGDQASSEAALLHALDEVERRGHRPEILVFLQCTSPFTGPEEIDALVAALDDPSRDCALTVARAHSFFWRETPGGAQGINHDESRPRERRQDRAPEFQETGAGYAMRVDRFREVGRRFCGPVALVETRSAPIEIDTPSDLDHAAAYAQLGQAMPLPAAALQRLRALVTDFDGVHTDDTVTVDQNGLESVVCSRSDGFGIGLLKSAGLCVLILSREVNPVVARRAEKLKVEVIHGAMDKAPLLADWLARNGLDWDEIAYIGNDDNDIDCMEKAGISFAPADARISALRVASRILSRRGGDGAVREACDLLLSHHRMVG